ncbi:hypothetical protein KAK07_18480 [Ideonella sp. 4Y16]|uniref:hypothetical protein n=1 Tax=Ideonella alba TaxID=2824118 RepID=UPI001B3605F6|nr:hypothetical protein [Ideonella alba]MBQ0945332.1 hypothetical protein [Ideonella alba]
MRALASATLALLLCACATPSRWTPGEPLNGVVARLGYPTYEFPGENGQRVLEYATGPFGKYTYQLRFAADERLLSGEQVLTEANFATIVAGMSTEDLRRRIGPPAKRFRVARPPQTVWAYRYDAPFCQWFMVGVGDDGRVMDTAYGPDPACEVNDGDLLSMGRRR